MIYIAILLIIGSPICLFLIPVKYNPIKDSDYMRRKQLALVSKKIGRDIKELITPFLDWLESKLR